MKLARMLALTLALVLVACELGPLAAAGDESSEAATKKKPTKLRRTIRVKETVPPAEVPAETKEPAPEQPAKSVEMHNVGPTNNVDVQPNISIASPGPQAQTVPAAPAAVAAEEPEEAAEEPQPEPKPAPQIVVQPVSHTVHYVQGLANSSNQYQALTEGSNNVRQTVLRNSGNSEHVHIDGVGNQKVTHISNAHNGELQNQSATPACKHANGQPAAQQQMPFVQINMNELGRRESPPMMVVNAGQQPAIWSPASNYPFARQVAPPQFVYPGASGQPVSVSPAQATAPYQTIVNVPAPLTMVPPSALPQPSPLFAVPQPMFYPQPMFFPPSWWPRGQSVKSDRRARQMMRRIEKRLKKMERRQKRAESSESDKPAEDGAEPAPKPVKEAEKEEPEPVEEPEEEAAEEEVEEAEVEAEEEGDDVIEWKTVRVPHRRRQVKRARVSEEAADAVAALPSALLSGAKKSAASLAKPLASLTPAVKPKAAKPAKQ